MKVDKDECPDWSVCVHGLVWDPDRDGPGQLIGVEGEETGTSVKKLCFMANE